MSIKHDQSTTSTVLDGEITDHEHFGWCDPHRCLVVRPDRWAPDRRTVRHRCLVTRGGLAVETFLITTQDPGGPVEVAEHGVVVLHLDDTDPWAADWIEMWGHVILAGGSAGSQRQAQVTR